MVTIPERIDKCKSAVGKKLLHLMDKKKSNLAVTPLTFTPMGSVKLMAVLEQVAVDVTSKLELLSLADQLGPHICMLKTHADIIRDWDASTGTSTSFFFYRNARSCKGPL